MRTKLGKLLIACMVVTVVLVLSGSVANAFGMSVDGNVYYNRETTVYPVMNADTSNDLGFLNAYIGKNNNSVYNVAPEFEKDPDSEGADEMPGHLTFGTKFTHESDSNSYNVFYHYGFEDPFQPAVQKGDLAVSLIADLHNDKHWNIDRHVKTWTAYPTAYISTVNDILIKHETDDVDNDKTVSGMGRNVFEPAGANIGGLGFGAIGQVCTCGSSWVRNISIILADTVGPKVTSVWVTRERPFVPGEMQEWTNFKAGDTLYINLKFNERIRFAGDVAMPLEDAPKLRLKVKGIDTDAEEPLVTAEASLVSLDLNTLTFKYVVPPTFPVNGQDVNTNYYIYEIAPYAQQTTWISETDTFDLKLFGKCDGGVTYLDAGRKTSSMIVDLAGNPVQTGGSVVTLKAPAYMDNVAPTVRRIDLVRPSHKYAATPNATDVFATMGEKAGFYVYFSEEVVCIDTLGRTQAPWPESLLAELNISKGGTPVRAVAKSASTVRDGLNGPVVSKIYFEMEQPFSSDMAPVVWGDRDLAIGLNRIYMNPGDEGAEDYVFGDIRGNQYDPAIELVNAPDGSRVMPAQQLWLDTTKPVATTSQTSGENGYETIPFDDGFCFPVTSADPEGLGSDYQSFTNGATGAFRWKDNADGGGDFMFEYRVTQSVERPTSGWRSGKTDESCAMYQVDSGSFIHIRLLPDVNYNMGESEMVIYPVDWAQNVGQVSFPLDLKLDKAGPRIISNGYRTAYSSVTGGSIHTSVTVRDVSKISAIQYQWTGQGADAVEEDWATAADFLGGSVDNDKTFILALDGLPSGADHKFTLHVRAKDINDYGTGYDSPVAFDMGFNLETPAYGIDFVTNPGTPRAEHSCKVYLPDKGDTPSAGDAVKLWVLVKNPATGNYWIRSFSYDDVRGEGNAFDIFDPEQDFSQWDTTTPAYKNAAPGYDDGIPVADMSGTIRWLSGWRYMPSVLGAESGIEALLTGSYGKVEVTVIAKDYYRQPDLSIWDSPCDILDCEIISKDTYSFSMMNGAAIGGGTVVHRATITPGSPVDHVGSFYVPSGELTDTEIDSQAIKDLLNMPSTLDGVTFNVELRNSRMPAYGLLDIDFDSPDTCFALYKTGNDTPLFTTPLAPAVSQDVAIPPGVATETGDYKVAVSMKTKSGAHIDRNEYSSISIDTRKPDTYGVTKVFGSLYVSVEGGKWVTSEQAFTNYVVSPGNRTSEIFISGGQAQYIDFGLGVPSLSYGGYSYPAAYIKIWNQTLADLDSTDPRWIPADEYRWISWDGSLRFDTWAFSGPGRDNVIYYLNDPPAMPRMPLLAGDNVLKYQIALPSTGYKTPVQTLVVHAGTEKPTITMMLSPEKSRGTTKEGVVASIQSLSSEVVSPDSLQVGLMYRDYVGLDPALKTTFKEQREVTLTENGEYWFYAYDRYNNFGYQKVAIDWIDKQGPTLAVDDLSDAAKNTFNFKATVNDSSGSENCRLYMQFDDAYCSVLEVDPGTAFEIPTDGQWTASRVSPSGLFSTSRTASGASRVFNVAGAFKFDSSPGAPASATRTITVYAVDGAGNESAKQTINVTAKNQRAAYVSGALAGGFAATFNKPVVLSNPSEGSLQPTYALTKTSLPVFANGLYTFRYSDIFGDEREESVTVDQYDDLYNCSINISETGPTNRDVTVAISTAFNEAVVLEPPADVPGATIDISQDQAGNVNGATVTMTRNGTVSYKLVPKDPKDGPSVTRSIVVNNIDKVPPEVGLMWAYSADVANGETAGDVTASLDSNEVLVPLAGTGTTHVFTFTDSDSDGDNDEVSYTFQYSDVAGNTGTIDATLPVSIVEKPQVPEDATPPDYEFSIYKMDGGALTRVGRYTRAAYEEFYGAAADKSTAFPLFSGVLNLQFTVTDENQTTISVKDSSAGMTVLGNTVTATGNGDYVIVIADAMGNQTEVPVSIGGADNTPPTGSLEYVKLSEFGIRAYLAASDESGPVTVSNTSGVLIETADGPHKGQYYHDFLDNGSFTFAFTDVVGNTGTAVAAVATLDMSYPTGAVQRWVPYFVDGAGVADEDRLSDRATNSDVSVYVVFDKSIRAVVPSIVGGAGSLDDISVSQTSDSATVVFREDAKVQLAYTALNSRSGSMILEVGIIDKKSPTIDTSEPDASPGSVTYTFTSDEKVFFEDQDRPEEEKGTPLVAATSFTKAFTLNGTYSLKFTDLAGNSTVTQVTVEDIDREAPGITVLGLHATKEEVAAYNSEHDPDVAHTLTKGPVTFTASINEPGRITFLGVSYPVGKDQIVTLAVENNGTYEMTATDLVGLSTRYRFKVDCVDRVKPQIVLSRATLLVKQGTSVADFEALACAGVQVIDNCDAGLQASITSGLTSEQLNATGTYSIEFTAVDSAGNQQVTTAFARVYDKDMVEVRVNGNLALPGETLFVDGNGSHDINVTVANLPGSGEVKEPYRMYWKHGLNTPGQMKTASEFAGAFAAPRDGLYTIQIVTQSRTTLLLYIYFQG